MRHGFRITLLGSALMASAPAVAGELPEDTATYIRQAVASGTYVGAIVGLVDGDQVIIQSFGTIAKDSSKAPDADTVFEIGSITKTFTGTLLASEVLAGRMTLDDPVQTYLPAGTTMPQIGERPMTIGSLATHYSGLPRLPLDFAPKNPADPYADFDEAKLWQTVNTIKPARAPGTAFEYSNFGYGLLGTLIARETGTSFRQLAADRIFKPLGMTHSDTVLTDEVRQRIAQGYDGAGSPVPHWTFDALAGAGAIYSNMTDMLAYLRANMAAAAGTGDAKPPRAAMALAQEPRADAGAGKIGLAWLSAPGKTSFAHDGGTYGFSSFIGFTADGKRGVVVLANVLASETTSAVGAHLINAKVPLPPIMTEIALAPAMLAQYVGTYALAPGVQIVATQRPGGIALQITGQAASPIFASALDRFYYKAVPVRVEFDRDADKRVTRLVLHQAGQRFRGPRLGTDGKPVAQPARLTLNAAQLDAYAGRYQLAQQAMLTITRDGDTLMAQITGQPAAAPIFAETADHFQYETADIDLFFERDAAGQIVAVSNAPGAPRASKLAPDASAP